ncbi:hypothetical protein AOQ88_01135 [Candidatus Riesia sp. GBBU]|nr:hypothetical protein AOQ88_01135 [Candidatus Riesia sp. GBBU]
MRIKKKDSYWMSKAIHLAKIAEKNGEIPIGAILVYKDKQIASGRNNSIFFHDPCAHAEILALRIGGKYLKNYRLLNTTLYVTLIPCIMCLGAILNARIKRLVYGANQNKIYSNEFINSMLKKKFNHKIIVSGGILKDRCSDILNNFFLKRRNKTFFEIF